MSPSDDPHPRWPAHRRLAAAALAAVVIIGAALVLLPIGWELNRFIVWLYYAVQGVFGFSMFTIEGYSVLLNVLLFAVPAFLASVVWPSVRWWAWPLLGLAASSAIELTQLTLLPRGASIVDVISNTTGAALGAAVLPVWRAWHTRADGGATQ